MDTSKNYSDATKSVHAGIHDNEHLAVIPPIYQTSTFKFKNADHGAAVFKGDEQGYIYTRMGNPTVEALEDAVAALEGGHKGLACSSGMAAINTVFSAYLKSGDHVVCSETVYGPTTALLNSIYDKFGVETTFVDVASMDEIKAAVKPNTKMIYMETPGNPTLVVADLAACAELAKEIGAPLVVDNTFMSPVLQKPFEFGADVVIHSMTKFLNGHADVVAGMIVVKNDDDYKMMRRTLNLLGGFLAPLDAFLVHRGIKTLAARMEIHSRNAMKIAEYLEKHEKVAKTIYPGLKSHPQHELCKKQMKYFGGMISFELKGGLEAGKTLMNNVKLCQLAVSLGGVETLIQHPASMTHAIMSRDERLKAQITDGLVRLSVGIENVDEIIDDLEQALKLIEN
jgi:methionine-gamma-lyase